MSEHMPHDEHDGRDLRRRWEEVTRELRFLEEHDAEFPTTFRQLSYALQGAQVVRYPDVLDDPEDERDRLLLAPARVKRMA